MHLVGALVFTETSFLRSVANWNAPIDVPRISRGSLVVTKYASGFCRWRGRGSGSIGRRNLDLSDLPFYPTGQIKPDYTIGYQMFVRFTAWKYVFGGRIPGFNNDL